MTTATVTIRSPDGSERTEEWEVVEIDGARYLKAPTSPYTPSPNETFHVTYPLRTETR